MILANGAPMPIMDAGYALGFDAKPLEIAFDQYHGAPLIRTFPVTYNQTELIEVHRKIIDGMFGLISLPTDRILQDAVIKAYTALLTTSFMPACCTCGLVL